MANKDANLVFIFFFGANLIAIPTALLGYWIDKDKFTEYHGAEKSRLWVKQSMLSFYFVFSSLFSVPAFLLSLSKDVHMHSVFAFLWAAFCVWGARRY